MCVTHLSQQNNISLIVYKLVYKKMLIVYVRSSMLGTSDKPRLHLHLIPYIIR